MKPTTMATGGGIRGSRIQRWKHTDFGAGIPYYDEEFDLGQSKAHKEAVRFLLPVLAWIAEKLGLECLSDNPIWYIDPETDQQKWFAGDLVFAECEDVARVTAEDLKLVMEIVSIDDKRKEKKDTVFQKARNEYNDVPEFLLYYPELRDERCLHFYRFDETAGIYRAVEVDPSGRLNSASVPGLSFSVLPRSEWKIGKKIAVFFEGEEIADYSVEREARIREQEARMRAEDELQRLRRKYEDG